MAVKRPDIYEHNNPDLPIVDVDNVAGATKIVANQAAMLAIPVAKLKEGSKARYFNGVNWEEWELLDISDPTNIANWQQVATGGGASNWGDLGGTLSNQTDLQAALDAKQNTSEKGQPNGFASLDGSGLVPSAQLPSYVDDVLEFANQAAFPATGEAGKIYIATDVNHQFRWSGTVYVQITSDSAAWGNIGGSLASQTDLQAALDAKAAASHTHAIGDITDLATQLAAKLVAADIDTLAKLNAILSDATLIDTSDPRLSDARTPTAHNHVKNEITDFPVALSEFTDDVYSPTPASGITATDIDQIRSAISYNVFNFNKLNQVVINTTTRTDVLAGTMNNGANFFLGADIDLGASYRFTVYGVANFPTSGSLTVDVLSATLSKTITGVTGSDIPFIIEGQFDFFDSVVDDTDLAFSGYIKLGNTIVAIPNTTLTINFFVNSEIKCWLQFSNSDSDITIYKGSVTRNTL